MELYYKDLISEEASLEKLVDDLMLVVQGTGEFAAGSGLKEEHKAEILTRLQRIKSACRQIEGGAIATAQAAKRALRQYPYWSAGFAFALGLLAGSICRAKRGRTRTGPG
ncbi:MAG TPA: hypothetical protein VN578_20720 [Candidatus Binatia bacterium]|jgi:ElaB/YqjD/DUF883 family membrane-anchored ribosome-binding protein|nr:hypothetical protein [Candidatus Binatia bacterium]